MRRLPKHRLWVVLGLLLVADGLFAVHSGPVGLRPAETMRTLFGYGSPDAELILFDIRLPRIVLAMLVGAGLAVAGAIMQGISRNALADPGILGVNAGAGLAVVLYVAYFYGKLQYAPVYALPAVAFVGAAFAAALVVALAHRNGAVVPMRLLLVGIALTAGIGAAMLFLTYRMNAYNYTFVKVWMTGSIWGTNWTYVRAIAVWIAVLLPLAVLRGYRINLLTLGEQTAAGLGMPVRRERVLLLAIAVGLAGSCVAVAGSIGFVGLLAPHWARMACRADYRALLPASALAGAILVLLADTIGRTIAQPVEIPVGVVVAAIGAPYFLFVLMRK
ncbi:FecCD family ABC transporter permease [Paenibacillus cymbidii]|uniref:FecCD family ABC transporter permease n=1 Tax=Paenibacillus cymbidii TaxID=1639034 RepID=UPI001080ADE2|nr:iron ABC transporter permease [Paenibacillus cymbidii]